MAKLWKHQQEGLDWIYEHEKVILAYGMGTGKTFLTLTFIEQMGGQHLIFAPKRVCDVWTYQIDKHELDFNVVFIADDATVNKRAKRLIEAHNYNREVDKPFVVITNYAVLSNKNMRNALRNITWDSIICDESHNIKSHNSKRSEEAFKLGRDVRYKIALTGTPYHNSPLDIYGQVRFVDFKVLAPVVGEHNLNSGKGWTHFMSKFAVTRPHNNVMIPVAPKNLAYMSELLEKTMLVKRTEDVVDVPELVKSIRPVDLGKVGRKVYKTLKKDYIAELEEGVVTADNVLVKTLRLQQLTGGFMTNDEGDTLEVDTAKLKELEYIVSEMLEPDEPLVIFHKFTQEFKALFSLLSDYQNCAPALLNGSNDTLHLFTEGASRFLIVQIDAGAEGIDLSRARYCVFYSNTFSLGTYEQALARLIRPNSEHKTVYALHLLAKDTIDYAQYDSLEEKRDITQDLLSGRV